MTNHAPSFKADTALVYLARYAEGVAAITAFVDSYQRHPAGMSHDVIVVRKGFPEGLTEFDRVLAPLSATEISIGDEGLDITAYAAAACRMQHRQIVCLNTFSEIAADDWLLKLHNALAAPGVGIAGATGSYESPRTSMRRLKKGLFLAQRQFMPSLSRLRGAFQLVRRMLPKHLSRYLVNHLISRLMAPPQQPGEAPFPDAEFEAFWVKETTADGTYDALNAVPEFPNPHLRTNGFIIERQLFLDLVPQEIATKSASYLFESGPDSLTAQVIRNGLNVVVVGRDGASYGIADWPRSRTFRLGDQANLLIHDNQTRAFAAMTPNGRIAFAAMAWGDDPEATG